MEDTTMKEHKKNILGSLVILVYLMENYLEKSKGPLSPNECDVLQSILNFRDLVDRQLGLNPKNNWKHLKEVARGDDSAYQYDLAIDQSAAFYQSVDIGLSYYHGSKALLNIIERLEDVEDEAC